MYRGTFAVIDLGAFSHNVRILQSRLAESTGLMLAIKANAYGHGVGEILGAIQKLDVDQVAVATLEEALEVRRLDSSIPILLMGALGSRELPIAAVHRIDVLYTDSWGPLQDIAESFDPPLRVHIPFDTGMNRLGIKEMRTAKGVIDWIKSRPDVVWQAVCTHLASSDAVSTAHAEGQVAKFREILDGLASAGYHVPLRHAANSGGTLRNRAWHFDRVRIGIAAYGYSPDESVIAEPHLKSVMHVYSTITRVATVAAGETIGYGATYTADRTMRVATVAIGYADGYPRSLSNCGVMAVHGLEAPIVGRVCMDQVMIDVTQVQNVAVGDFVTVFGRATPATWTSDGWRGTEPAARSAWIIESFTNAKSFERDVVSLSRIASLAQTIPYEIVCQLSPRVPKLFVESTL